MAYPYKGFDKSTNYVEENLDYRTKVNNRALEDTAFQALLMSMSAEDCLFWINTFVYTFDPRKPIPHTPFITYPFQDEFITGVIKDIEAGKDVFVDKSRDMGVSWMILAIFLWGWLFKGWELREGSRKMDYVDKGGDMTSLFEKQRYMLERLPSWMIPYKFDLKRGTTFNSSAKLVNPITKNTIVGEATSPNFARGGRSKAILYDEFAFWLCSDEAWRGGADTSNCRIIVSTPNGKGNKFADIKFDTNLDISRYTLHWRLHPFKTMEWYKEECARRTPQEIAQELDISYDASTTSRVYEGFDKVRIGDGADFEYNAELPLFVAWDFGEGGNDATAIIWAQFDQKNGNLKIIDCYSRNALDINYFGTIASGVLDSQFDYDSEALYGIERRKRWKRGVHIGDPYNGNKTTFVGNTSIQKELRKHGIQVNLDRGCNSVIERIRLASMFLPGLMVNSRCKGFIESMQNSRWPKSERMLDKQNSPKKPVHNQFSHYRTAFEYLCEYLDGYRTKTKRNRFFQGGNKGTIRKRDNYANILR